MPPSFVALSVDAVSVFKSFMTLRCLGDKACHLIESHLLYNIWRMKVVQGLCNSTRNVWF